MAQLIQTPTWKQLAQFLGKNPDAIIGLAGPPGIGKTSFAYSLFKYVKKPYIGKIQFHSELSPAEVMGMHVPKQGGFSWEPGPGDLAYSQGGGLILDEIDQASGPTKTYCYALLDRGPGGTVNYVGRIFSQTPGYQPLATMNGDPTDGSLPDALLDRFDAWYIMQEPTEQLYKLLEPDLRKACRAVYQGERHDPLLGPAFSFRSFMALQKLREVLPLDQSILGACHGNQKLARSFYEAYTLSAAEPDDDEEDEDEEIEAEDEEADEDDEEVAPASMHSVSPKHRSRR